MNKGWLERQSSLIGEDKTDRLISSCVMVIGIGGVGSYVAEAVARCGVGRMILVDHDTVSLSNIHRQLVADTVTVGMKKTAVMADRIHRINPHCITVERDAFVTAENVPMLFEGERVDYVVDAIDNVTAKIAVIDYCKKNSIGVISSMGTGNKLDPSRFEICDISKTSVCPLARVMRKELRDRGINGVDVLYSREEPVVRGQRVPASIAFVPSSAGLMIAGHVILKLTE